MAQSEESALGMFLVLEVGGWINLYNEYSASHIPHHCTCKYSQP